MSRMPVDRMSIGDIVSWSTSKNHDYFNDAFRNYGILLRKIEEYEHWVFCDVLNKQGKVDKVMLYKGENPL